MTQSHMKDSSTCNVLCLSPGQPYNLSYGCSRHGIPVMRLPEACHVVDIWYFLLSLSIISTDPLTLQSVIQTWHICHKKARGVQDGNLLLTESGQLSREKMIIGAITTKNSHYLVDDSNDQEGNSDENCDTQSSDDDGSVHNDDNK